MVCYTAVLAYSIYARKSFIRYGRPCLALVRTKSLMRCCLGTLVWRLVAFLVAAFRCFGFGGCTELSRFDCDSMKLLVSLGMFLRGP